jgi:hypothetical protein
MGVGRIPQIVFGAAMAPLNTVLGGSTTLTVTLGGLAEHTKLVVTE